MKCSNECVMEANKWHKDEGGLCACGLVKKLILREEQIPF